MFPMTKLELAKTIASMAVALKTAKVCKHQVAEHTEFNSDGIPVTIGSWIAGQYVASKTKPYTDVAVEKAYSWFTEKFNKNDEKLEYKSDR